MTEKDDEADPEENRFRNLKRVAHTKLEHNLTVMRFSIVALLAGVLLPVTLQAEVNGGYTAEWIAHKAEEIALVTPITTEISKGPGDVWFTRVQFRIDDFIKGPLKVGDSLTVYDYSYSNADPFKLREAVRLKRKLLLYASTAKNMFAEIDGKYVFSINHAQRSAYYLDEPTADVYTPEFNLITDVKELARRTREQVDYEQQLTAQNWKGTIQEKEVNIPWHTEAWEHVFRGSSCFLTVPEYRPE